MGKKKTSMILLIIAIVLFIAIIGSGVAVLLLLGSGLESISISPTFADTELDINMDYIISVNTDPKGKNTEKFEYEADSSAASFEYKDDGTAILHTNGEGAVTVTVSKGKVESNALTFKIVDKAAQAAAEAAAAEAAAEQERLAAEAEAQAAAAEAEAQAAAVRYIKCTKDNVNIRSNASTDGDVLGKAKLGQTFEVINDDGSWTEFKYGDGSGFMRNDMVELLPEGTDPSTVQETPVEEKKEEAKQEEKKPEEKKPEKTPEQIAAEQAAAAQAAAEQAAAEAAAQAAAAAAAQAATGMTINCADGPHTFRPDQYNFIKGFWSYTGAWEEMAHKHTYSELILVCQVEGHLP